MSYTRRSRWAARDWGLLAAAFVMAALDGAIVLAIISTHGVPQ